jgi:hypothetical protein
LYDAFLVLVSAGTSASGARLQGRGFAPDTWVAVLARSVLGVTKAQAFAHLLRRKGRLGFGQGDPEVGLEETFRALSGGSPPGLDRASRRFVERFTLREADGGVRTTDPRAARRCSPLWKTRLAGWFEGAFGRLAATDRKGVAGVRSPAASRVQRDADRTRFRGFLGLRLRNRESDAEGA